MSEHDQIDIHQVKKMIDQGNLTIVDIRDDCAFSEAHIRGAVSVNDTNIEEFVSQTQKEKPLLCYCYHGNSSQEASQYFRDSGFTSVYSMIGGFEQWRQEYSTNYE